MVKENARWYSWYPGMEEQDNKEFKLIQYDISMHTGLKDKHLSTTETVISLYLGEVICSGHFFEDDMVYLAILQRIKENELLGVPLNILSDYSADFDFLIILRRKIGDYECS